MFFDPGASLRLCTLTATLCSCAVWAGCEDDVRRRDPDGSVVDSGPRDASTDAATVDAADAATTDAGTADAGGAVTCVAGTAIPLIDTLYVPGGRVIFDAEANIDGVFVAATIQKPADYPNYERTSAFLSSAGAASAPVALSSVSMAVSTSIAVTRSSTGFIAAFDETADLGVSPKDLWVRTAVAGGGLVGTNAVALVSTPSATESNADFIQTSTGFAGVWQQAGVGPVTAVFDVSAALVGSSHVATGTLGSAGVTHLFTTGTQNFVAYLGGDSHVHSAAIGADGTVAASSSSISVLTSSANFAVASGAGGAGLAYESLLSGAMTAVTFRALSANGTSAIAERTLHGIDERGSRPSVAALAGGYLVLFRFVPTSGTAKLRLVWVTTSGDSVSNLDLVDSLPAEAQYAVRVSPDGEVYVLYQEAATFDVEGTPTAGATLKALRLVCE